MPFCVSTCTEAPGTRLSANRAILALDVIHESLTLVFTACVVDDFSSVDFFSSAALTHAGDAASARPTTTLALSLVIRCIASPPFVRVVFEPGPRARRGRSGRGSRTRAGR